MQYESYSNEYWMARALELAQQAKYQGEIPIGAVIVQKSESGYYDQIIAESFNKKEQNTDATAHAEILAIQEASQRLGRWRLSDCNLYVTLEPCLMCLGAIVAARFDRLVFGAWDKKAGAVISTYNFEKTTHFNHYPKIQAGLLEQECSQILKDFFEELRVLRKR